MEKAIITGATGSIGSYVINELLANGIKVLAIGRRTEINLNSINQNLIKNLSYCQLDLKDINLLPEKLKKIDWVPGKDCVFYHFAWIGSNTLTDGTITQQLKNVSYSANAIKIAKKIGCIKFVNSGSLEESFFENYLKNNWRTSEYHSDQSIYAISKMSARDMCLMVSYLEKIDYVHTRFSAVYNKELDFKGYICSSLKLILKGLEINPPKNTGLFDIISVEDLSKAYFHIGLNGRNKANYFIGTGKPKTLLDYFSEFKNSIKGFNKKSQKQKKESDFILNYKDFDVNDLKNDTGFEINNKFLKVNI